MRGQLRSRCGAGGWRESSSDGVGITSCSSIQEHFIFDLLIDLVLNLVANLLACSFRINVSGIICICYRGALNCIFEASTEAGFHLARLRLRVRNFFLLFLIFLLSRWHALRLNLSGLFLLFILFEGIKDVIHIFGGCHLGLL